MGQFNDKDDDSDSEDEPGIEDEADCMEFTNLEGMILAMFMVQLNEMTDIDYKSFSQQYQF